MPTQILDLPSELLLQILSSLSTQSLLRFAQTSKHARNLAYSDLHNLSLAVYPSHRSSWHNKLFATQHEPKYDRHTTIQIPRAWDFDYSTLLKFHNKIIASILTRHAFSLQRLELTLWTISLPIAKALVSLPALRELSIHMEPAHCVPRAHISMQRREEIKAWDLLAADSTWMSQVQSLSITSADVTPTQLASLVSGTRNLRSLRLRKCDMLTSSIWDIAGLQRLRQLSLAECVHVHVAAPAVDAISKMHELQCLALQGCSGLDGEVLERWNRDVWRVPVFTALKPRGALKAETSIEVDPEYMLGED